MDIDKLKFRVWDDKEKFYQEADADHCVIDYRGRLHCDFWGDGDCYHSAHLTNKDVDIEPCIGLKDKNSRLIFLGDVLKNGECLLEVCWSPTLASYMLDDYMYNEAGEYEGYGNLYTIHATEIAEMEVVGNIHEGVKNDTCNSN